MWGKMQQGMLLLLKRSNLDLLEGDLKQEEKVHATASKVRNGVQYL